MLATLDHFDPKIWPPNITLMILSATFWDVLWVFLLIFTCVWWWYVYHDDSWKVGLWSFNDYHIDVGLWWWWLGWPSSQILSDSTKFWPSFSLLLLLAHALVILILIFIEYSLILKLHDDGCLYYFEYYSKFIFLVIVIREVQ